MVRICHPLGDGISSVFNLLDSVILRVAIWLVAITTCGGNAFVIVCRFLLHDEHNSHSLFIKNLAGNSPHFVSVKVNVKWISIAPKPLSRSGMDHTVLPANYTIPAFT